MNLGRSAFSHSVVGMLAFGASLAISLPAAAEKATVAENLFDQGIRLMEQEKFDRACPFLEESYRREPLLGALIALADCEYERGRLATALERYREYVNRHDHLANVARQKQGNRLREATARVAELTSSVPTIKVVVPPKAKVPTLHLDGVRIKPGQAYPVDPGKYEVTLDVYGRETSRTLVEARKGDKKIVSVDLGKALPPKGPKRIYDPDAKPDEVFDYEADEFQRKVGIGIGTAELILITTAVIFGARVIAVEGTTQLANFTAGPMSSAVVSRTGPSTAIPPIISNPSTIATTSAIALATGGIVWSTLSGSKNHRSQVEIVPMVNLGNGPTQPTFVGIQGRF